MGEQLLKRTEPLVIDAIDNSEQIKTSLAVATSVETGFAIKSAEDMEQAGDSLRLVKRGITAIESALTEAFRPFKAIERMTRDLYAPKKMRLEQTAGRLTAEMTKWDRAEQARIREEQVARQREADDAALAAAAATPGPDDEEPLPPAQVVVPQAETKVRGSVSTTSKVRRVVAQELLDPLAAQEQWGSEVVTFHAGLAKQKYDAKMKLGLLNYPKDGGEVVGGILFVTETTFSSRSRGGAR